MAASLRMGRILTGDGAAARRLSDFTIA
jgi:hypothetical protein